MYFYGVCLKNIVVNAPSSTVETNKENISSPKAVENDSTDVKNNKTEKKQKKKNPGT